MEPMETERLVIRRFTAADSEDLYEYLSDPEVVRFEPYEPHTREEAEREAARRAGDENFFAVCRKDTGKLIGNIYFQKGDFDTWELGYVFNARHQGHGFATEAARAVADRAFRDWGARRIIAMCNPLNDRSWRLMERLGMRREGHLRQNVFFKRDANGNPIWNDTYLYGILKDEWLTDRA